ncbi:unnamed protein product [Rotaria sp. Silwood2]|nr:unnamed protein product [Rotaria sp. Silwood2]
MYRLIDYICLLITNNHKTETTFNETSRWYLALKLNNFQWRIPSVWYMINDHAKELLDHPQKPIRQYIANVLVMSISFNVILPNGKSTRHPNIDQFIDTLCERLHQAIEVYERAPLVNYSDHVGEINHEARKALNLIDTGVLGLCAIILSSPYDISLYVPDALVLLCEHSQDPDPIQTSKKTCLSQFHCTHHNLLDEH